MLKIKYEEWCKLNKLNPNKNTSKTAFEHFIKAFNTQSFINKIMKRKEQEQQVVQCL